MSSRLDIVSALYSAITSVDAFSGETYWGAPQVGARVPNVVLRATNDAYSDGFNSMDGAEARSLSVEVILTDDVSITPSSGFNTYLEDIETAIYSSSGVTSLVRDMVTEDISFEYSDETETPLAQGTLNITIEYIKD